MNNSSDPVVVEQWWKELERLERILGQVGPDEVCCDGKQRSCDLGFGEDSRISDLAAMSSITPSATTRVLEKLERRGLVERVRGAQIDGRAAMVRITTNGHKTRKVMDELIHTSNHNAIFSVRLPF